MSQTRPYQICTKTVMDTSDPDITFDKDGICNHYYQYQIEEKRHVLKGEAGQQAVKQAAATIRAAGKNRQYDCILGLSGGVDSTYLCLLAKQMGLRPLVVHFDNGWNSELAVQNIEQTVKRLNFDLYTYVVDWSEFRELQRSYFAANVVDIEVLTDHGFMAVLYRQALKHKIKFVLAGMNIVTESILPRAWIYDKSDLGNIQGIQLKHGTKPLRDFKSFPFLSPVRKTFISRILKMQVVTPLNWVEYNYSDVKEQITQELGWRDYGGKHYESIFTRFYQGAILPRKFKFDKRRAHLSTLICSGQITRGQAIVELEQPSLAPRQEKLDRAYLLKKLGFSVDEFEKYLVTPPVPHSVYGTSKSFFQKYPFLKPLSPLARKLFP